jgi:hypothetical protein
MQLKPRPASASEPSRGFSRSSRGLMLAPLTSIVELADGSQDRASGGSYGLFPCAWKIIWRSAYVQKKMVHRGFRCTPRMAGSGGGFTMRDTVSCTSAGAGRTELPRGRRERQADGSPAEGHPHFSGTPFPPQRPAAPPFRFIRCAIPRTVPSREPLRERPRPSRGPGLRQIAHRVFVEAGSGPLAAGGRRRAGDEDGGIGISQKNSHGPLPRFHPSAVPDASTHVLSNPRPPPCPDTIPLHRGSSRPWRARPQFATKSAMNPKNSHGPLPHSISLPFPAARAGSCLVGRRAMPYRESRGKGTRKLC